MNVAHFYMKDHKKNKNVSTMDRMQGARKETVVILAMKARNKNSRSIENRTCVRPSMITDVTEETHANFRMIRIVKGIENVGRAKEIEFGR